MFDLTSVKCTCLLCTLLGLGCLAKYLTSVWPVVTAQLVVDSIVVVIVIVNKISSIPAQSSIQHILGAHVAEQDFLHWGTAMSKVCRMLRNIPLFTSSLFASQFIH